jgi:hypothetical protein
VAVDYGAGDGEAGSIDGCFLLSEEFFDDRLEARVIGAVDFGLV